MSYEEWLVVGQLLLVRRTWSRVADFRLYAGGSRRANRVHRDRRSVEATPKSIRLRKRILVSGGTSSKHSFGLSLLAPMPGFALRADLAEMMAPSDCAQHSRAKS